MYVNIPDKFIRQLARKNGVKIKREYTIVDIISEIEKSGHGSKLKYLDEQFRYAGAVSALSICKPVEDFPEKSQTPEKFIDMLVKEKHISKGQGKEWQPNLKSSIQLCGVMQDGPNIFIKMVEGKKTTRRFNYDFVTETVADITTAVIRFSDQVIELRCAYSYRKKYADYLFSLLGFGDPTNWYSVTQFTKEQAKKIALSLSAGMASEHVAFTH